MEGYGKRWHRVSIMVHDSGEVHSIGGDAEPGNGESVYRGFEILKRRLNAGGSPDFKTVNSAIEVLTDSAQFLREKEGSTGFDASVALIIEWAIQALKSIETEGTSQPLQPSAVEGLRSYLLREYPWLHRLINEACAEKDGFEVISGFFSAPPAMPTMVHMPPLGMTAGTHKLKEDAAAEVPPEEVAGIGHAEASEPLQPAAIRGGTFEASPQLEQVAREIAAYVRGEFLKPLVCKPENDYLLDGLVPILQRHFPGSEGVASDECLHCGKKITKCDGTGMFCGCKGWFHIHDNGPSHLCYGGSTTVAEPRVILCDLRPSEGAASPPVAAAEAVQESNAARIAGVIAEAIHKTDPLYRKESTADAKTAPLTPRKDGQ